MGYYIETPSNHGKAGWLIEHHGAIDASIPTKFDYTGWTIYICVVDNGPFEAAGIAYDAKELERFNSPDHRPKRWLLMTKAKVIELCPKVTEVLTP